jgi:predicted Rossmann fold flavoprotein
VAESNPDARVTIYEKGKTCLAKVKISGGGRCNVTHNCFDPRMLAQRYPRGSRELRGAFHRWQPEDTIQWFADKGVQLKTEEDGRMFPVTDDSRTIIDCFLNSARRAGVRIRYGSNVQAVVKVKGGFEVDTDQGRDLVDAVCIACGSLKASPITRAIEAFGHTIEPLAPSLFAFNSSDSRIHDLTGVSVQEVSVQVLPKGSSQSGPILITHRGFSGPAILKLSAWEARQLQERGYAFEISINWLGDVKEHSLKELFSRRRKEGGKACVKNRPVEPLPRRLWERLVEIVGIGPEVRWAQLPKDKESALVEELIRGSYTVRGKTTNKDEFVTCGGVRLKEVDFRTMESRLVPGLFFAGECLDIDGITGGFNFQAAWTTGRIAAESILGDF